jgi:translocation and assembly module TamA
VRNHETIARARYWAAAWVLGLGLLLPDAPHAVEIPYAAAITGVEDASLRLLLESVSDTLAPGAPPPASLLHLRRRAERDQQRFLEVFQSRGHYGAAVALDINRDTAPTQVTFAADPGPVYTLAEVRIEAVDPALVTPDALPAGGDVGLHTGAPALAEAIAATDAQILRHLRERGYPAPRIAHRDVVVHHESRRVTVTFRVITGSTARYGQLRLSGLESVRPEVVNALLPWQQGAPYDERDLTTLRRRLYDTGLFSTATVSPAADDATPDGHVPVLAELTERAHRSVALGLEYKTDTGPGAQAHWEHRNIRGLGHGLHIDAALGTELRQLETAYRIDRFQRLDQTLTLTGGIAQEEREAYESERATLLAMLDRNVSERLTLGAGAGIRVSRVEQNDVEDSHALLHFPLLAALDRSDDPLNPTSGFRINARIEPFFGLSGGSMFVKGHLELSHYLGFGQWETKDGATLDNWVIATRLKLGLLAGQERDDVPADLRFYAGGGGSIRGYPFQTVSPLADDTPLGGRSLAEISFEVRKRVSDTIGLVAFVDGGSAFEAPYPDFSGDLKFGAGVGLRYYTPLGPIRLDVAVPLDRREGLDDGYQIYLSIGQAF